ncbi:MAG: hypothetical protein Q9166_002640 [cf. Caloplaca sp. 2 TL-2023]
MSTVHKLGLLTFLTMNVWLIIIAIVRVSSFKQGQTFDLTWIMFFQYLEPNVAILAACFTAFRSIFVRRGPRAQGAKDRPSHSFRQKLLRWAPMDHQPLDDLPTIPGAALTDTNSRDSTAYGQGLGGGRDGSNIHVKQDWSLESTKVAHAHDHASDRQFV